MRLSSLTLLLLPLLTAAISSNAILLSKIRTLTLRNGKQTTARRTSPIPQLKCIGGTGQGLYEVDAMRCTNAGNDYDGLDVQWTCTANLPPEFKLGSTEVMCEGYSSPSDLYVLKGSCGVEYRLQLTERGEDKYGSGGRSRARTWLDTLIVGFVLTSFGVVFALILYNWCTGGNRDGPARRPGFGGGWGGGGGGDDGNDPPPPYTQSPPPKGGSSGPGFWTGAAAGAAGGYMAGRAGNGGGWGGWGGRNNSSRDSWQDRSNFGRSDSTGSAGSSRSSTTYQSTGFGGTTRR